MVRGRPDGIDRPAGAIMGVETYCPGSRAEIAGHSRIGFAYGGVSGLHRGHQEIYPPIVWTVCAAITTNGYVANWSERTYVRCYVKAKI